MTRKQLLASLAAAAGISIAGSASAAITMQESDAYEAALSKGSVGLQQFLSEYPDSPMAGEALNQMIQLAETGKARGFERSGNPKAAGSPDNPGVGNPNTPDC